MKSSSILIITSVLTFAQIASAQSAGTCSSVFSSGYSELQAKWAQLSLEQKNFLRKQQMYSTSNVVQRRPVVKTSGLRQDASKDIDAADIKIDTADPSLVMPITYPNGVTKYRINFSGLRYIEANTPMELFKGGIKKVQRSRGFYKDGTEMTGAYHNEAWAWDVVIYKNEAGEQIALGGVMEQVTPGKLPNVAQDNRTRSRWWGKVSHVEVKPGVYEEHIIWQEPVHDFNRSKHQGWEYHGYGGTLVTEFNPKTGIHEPIKNKNGNYTLMYERVTEEQHGMPWVTTTFMREMDPSLKTTVGPEIAVTNLNNPLTGKLFESLRRGDEHNTYGYLREGDNVLKEIKNKQFVKAGSANDYVRKYGIYLDYRPPGADAVGPYRNVVDSRGEMVDFATTLNLREMMNATWVGRPQLNYDPQGRLWLLFHFVPKDSIPQGAPVEGWPSAKDFPEYGRITAMIPVKFEYDALGQPLLKKDIDPEFSYMYE
ncbi:hypothetical protein ACLSU7_08910 [Bdellovibrio sp. HCB185ZH]|uniref:hypothetical protein n=1 Tax=Bdellovibrio sp. HCB185ZH TaxID=3394235 RepID=UPI0039A4EFAD